jgi:integrase
MTANNKNARINAQKLKLISSDVYVEWQESLNSPSTRENYANHLAYFCRFHRIKASHLVAMAVDQIKPLVVKYLLHLKRNAKDSTPGRPISEEIHVNSLPVYMSGVKSFLDHLEKPIVWKKINKMLPEGVMSEIRAYSREEIQKILSVSDKRHRALELMMAAGGIRRGAPAQLKIENFEIFDETNHIGILFIYTKSRKWRYFCLLTPEATHAIEDYLKWRKDHGEVLKPESPLIRDKFDVFTARRNKPRFLDEKSILIMMERILKQASVQDPKLSPCHSFRHFFDTMLINSHIDERMKKFWMGHKAGLGLDSRYYDPKNPDSKKALLQEYLKAVDLLTINEEFRLKKEVIALKQELKGAAPREVIAELARDNQKLSERVSELAKSQEFFINILKNDASVRQRVLSEAEKAGELIEKTNQED